MSGTVIAWPLKPAPRFAAPMQGGCHTHACRFCGSGTFVIVSQFDGQYTAVKCATPSCGAVMMETQDEPDVDGAA